MKDPILRIKITITVIEKKSHVDSKSNTSGKKSPEYDVFKKKYATKKNEEDFFKALISKTGEIYQTNLSLIDYQSRDGSLIIEAIVGVYSIVSGYGGFIQGLEYMKRDLKAAYSLIFEKENSSFGIYIEDEIQLINLTSEKDKKFILFEDNENSILIKVLIVLVFYLSISMFVLSYFLPRVQRNSEIKIEYKVDATQEIKEKDLLKSIEIIKDTTEKIEDAIR